jgi:hypothetical protein
MVPGQAPTLKPYFRWVGEPVVTPRTVPVLTAGDTSSQGFNFTLPNRAAPL